MFSDFRIFSSQYNPSQLIIHVYKSLFYIYIYNSIYVVYNIQNKVGKQFIINTSRKEQRIIINAKIKLKCYYHFHSFLNGIFCTADYYLYSISEYIQTTDETVF